MYFCIKPKEMIDYNIHEFTEDIWMLVPQKIVSDKYIDENEDYFRDLLFFFYQKRISGLSTEAIAQIITEFLKLSFYYKPKMANILDEDFNLM
jgi:hypothetical protein